MMERVTWIAMRRQLSGRCGHQVVSARPPPRDGRFSPAGQSWLGAGARCVARQEPRGGSLDGRRGTGGEAEKLEQVAGAATDEEGVVETGVDAKLEPIGIRNGKIEASAGPKETSSDVLGPARSR